jgi:predicted O-methyltransferase YrrM
MKQGALLYRLTKWYQPNLILEFGTGLGISASYLAAGSGNAEMVSIEGSKEKHEYAVKNSEHAGTERVEFILGTFDSCFEMLLERVEERTIIFIDGDHRYLPTVEKVNGLLQKTSVGDMMIILDDIYWSAEMEKAWNTSAAHPLADISIDLFHFGILIKREGIAKQHLKLIF